MAEEKKYKQVRTPDFSRISKIVLAAKGVGRTMAQFAELTRLNASSLSRIANGKIKKPLTLDVIEAIMTNCCSECEYSKEDLIRANGMIDEDRVGRSNPHDDFMERRRAQRDRMISMRTILINELFRRRILYKRVSRMVLESLPLELYDTPIMQRLFLEMIESQNEKYWIINPNTIVLEPEEADLDLIYLKKRLLSSNASIFLTDAWEPDSLKDFKISFAFADERVYDSFRLALSNAKINSSMTTILIDVEKGLVVKEELLPGCKVDKQDGYFDLPLDPGDQDFSVDDDLMQLKFRLDDMEE